LNELYGDSRASGLGHEVQYLLPSPHPPTPTSPHLSLSAFAVRRSSAVSVYCNTPIHNTRCTVM
jgi:hypothetical protein